MTEDGVVAQFREALADCKRLYIQAARASLEDQPDADEPTRRDMIRRMVDLHKGLLIKIYAVVAAADARWSRSEKELACELIDHIWQQRLVGEELKEVIRRLVEDSGRLNWYSLVRPFDQVVKIRDMSADLQTIVMRIANLVAKADGTVTSEETVALHNIQHEIEVHLTRISLDGSESTGGPRQQQQQQDEATRIIYSDDRLSRSGPPQESDRAGAKGGSGSASKDRLTETAQEADSLERALADLSQLVGLGQVKQEIQTLTNYLTLQQRRVEAGLPRHTLSLHMVFNGNPGTGKTTVARIVGRIFKALGLLRKGHLIETDRSGLVAEYAGQTATKTNRKIDEALDGILFVDEAYSLVSADGVDAYGLEAIQALVKRMEDDRERLVVILAGYPGPMQQLLESNPGLSSRFNTQMTFTDYEPIDLGRIYQLMCEANHYQLPPEARAKLLLGFHWLYHSRNEHFGNGRLVRNTFENSVRRLADRIADIVPITRELLTKLTTHDICMADVPDEIWEQAGHDRAYFAVPCPQCARTVHLRARHLGTPVRCPHCQARFSADWGAPVIKSDA